MARTTGTRGWLPAMLMAVTMAMAWTTPAQAKPQFAAYEGPDSVQEGRGGTRMTRNGVDYWTTGAPPRRYQIIGIVTDNKCLGSRLCGDPIDRPAIADMVKANGGDAVIVLGKSNDARGMVGGASAYGGGNFATGYGWSAAISDHASSMLVIRYPPEGPRKP